MTEPTIQLLVVDDDPGMLAVLECGLAQNPQYRVCAVADAKQALNELHAGRYDLLVTDYSLGDTDINGIDLLRAARRLEHPPLVIIITAYASLQITLESISLGVHNFLTKPFQMDELFLVVRNAASQILMERENAQLRRRVRELAEGLTAIEKQHEDLIERFRRLEYEGTVVEGAEEPLAVTINSPQALELRRRRLRDQIAAYLRAGEDLGRRLQEQRSQLQAVIQSRLAE